MSIRQEYHTNPEFQALSKIISYYPSLVETLLSLIAYNKRGDLCPARSMINEKLSEKTVGHHTDKLHDDGIITKTRFDNKYRTCRYEVPPEVMRLEGRLRHFLKTLKTTFFSISLLYPAAIPDFPPNGKNRGLSTTSNSQPERDSQSTNRELVFLKKPSCYRERQTACAGAYACDGLPPDFSTRKKAEEAMNIPSHIEELSDQLRLTVHGKLKLSPFSESTIKQGMANLKHAKGSKDVFRTLIEDCVAIAKANNEPLSWQGYYKAIEMGLAQKHDSFTTVKISHASLFSGRSIRQQQAIVDPQKIQTIEERRAYYMAREKEKLAEKQRKWEASKTPAQLQESYQQVFPVVESMMDKFGATQDISSLVKSRLFSSAPSVPDNVLPVTKPTDVNQETISPAELAWIDDRFQGLRKLLKKGELNDFEKILVHNFQVQIEEAKSKFKIVDRWIIDLEDGNPTWSAEDKELMDWAVPFLTETATKFTKPQYDKWLAEIELGPDAPGATALKEGLALLRKIMTKPHELPNATIPVTNPPAVIECAPIDEIDDANLSRLLEAPHEPLRSSYDTPQPTLGNALPLAMGTSAVETGRSQPVQASLFRSAAPG